MVSAKAQVGPRFIFSYLHLCLALAYAVFAFIVPLLKESPRWLLSRGYSAEAQESLEAIIRFNGRRPPNPSRVSITGGHRNLQLNSTLQSNHPVTEYSVAHRNPGREDTHDGRESAVASGATARRNAVSINISS